jgi:hypothetical protein
MKILLTGPSCAGKTDLAKQFPADVLIHLDQLHHEQLKLDSRPENYKFSIILYEGIPSGSDSSVKKFLGEMDAVLLLEPAGPVRLLRCWRRDGWRNVLRWLYNEICWRALCRPLVRSHHNVRRIRWKAS